MKKVKLPESAGKAAPWLFGVGMGGGVALLSSLCTVPKTGKCAACGSCLFSIASLVGWAFIKSRNNDSIYSRPGK